MKKALSLIALVTVLGTVSMAAAPTTAAAKKVTTSANSLDSSLAQLEAQMAKLEEMEKARFNAERANAEAAKGRLAKLEELKEKAEARATEADEMTKTSFFGPEFKAKAQEYRALSSSLDKQIAVEQKTIDSFEALLQLQN